ncbi:beta-galactosidase trimerization domain protein [Roseburia intestinalis L1-82]|uniref:beta-galactosidase n=2 Tax=Roseburia intestinalis L1-82 TaxID=536231 RepID=C7GE51_9FIRM|nr:beta-galactosidase trimerization domain protein [Roseburia intestinalis L1-82]
MRKRLFILSFYIKLRKDITATVLKSASKARQYEPVIRRWGFYMKTEKLYFGAAYYSEYLPYDRVEKDMEMMEKAGMNVIRIAESTWSTLEPQEGVYDFTHIDRMLNAAACHHISVIVGTPTYAVPTWLVKKYPDILAITQNGRERYGHRQNMDITNPDYLSHAERVIRVLMEHVKDVPHVIGYQLDNETKSYGTAGPRVQAMFVDYLKEKFPDIDEFNHEFGLDYWSNRVNDWEDFPDVRGTINQSLAAEFYKFQRSLVTKFLSWQADIVREYKRDDQFITQNFDFDWTTHSVGYQSQVDQYDAARCMTVAGADIYHPSNEELTGAEITVCGNISRSLKKDNYLILETEAQGLTPWLPYPGQLRLQAYSHIANGSNSVMYWHWHSIHNAIESYWKGVLSHDFSENETYREAVVIGNEWKKIGSHLKNLKKENKIAIMLDNASLTGFTQFPLENAGANGYNTVMRWFSDALYRLNIEYDMISSKERDFSSYECLIVPALYSAPESLLLALDSYVRNGGHLITTFRSGFSDEYLKIYPDMQPHILHECLGLHYDQFTHPHHVDIVPVQSDVMAAAQKHFSHPDDSAFSLTSSACEWMELITCDTAVPVLKYSHPAYERYAAAAKNQYGNGSTLYFGTMFENDELLESVLLSFLHETGFSGGDLSSDAPHYPLIIKRGINDSGKELCYYLNYSKDPVSVTHHGKNGVELISETAIVCGNKIDLGGWGVAVVEM